MTTIRSTSASIPLLLVPSPHSRLRRPMKWTGIPRRLEATLIAKGPKGEAVYARGNGGVFLYNPDEHRFWTLGNPAEDLRGLLDQTAYMGAMESLGVVPEIGLDAK